jgi:riboflavin kinase
LKQILEGTVEHGDARGRELGFPTANVSINGRDDLDGIWAAYADVDGLGQFLATVSIGRRPTYYPDTAMRLIEVHLLDFTGDLYGRHISVELETFLRPQVRCTSESELIALIAADVRATRGLAIRELPQYHWPWMGLLPASA